MAFLDKCSWISKNIVLSWSAGDNEIGKEKGTDIIRVKVNPKYYRPTEVEQLLGDPSKAKSTFGWEPKVPFDELVKDMMTSDIELMKKSPNAWFYVLILSWTSWRWTCCSFEKFQNAIFVRYWKILSRGYSNESRTSPIFFFFKYLNNYDY